MRADEGASNWQSTFKSVERSLSDSLWWVESVTWSNSFMYVTVILQLTLREELIWLISFVQIPINNILVGGAWSRRDHETEGEGSSEAGSKGDESRSGGFEFYSVFFVFFHRTCTFNGLGQCVYPPYYLIPRSASHSTWLDASSISSETRKTRREFESEVSLSKTLFVARKRPEYTS